MRIIPIRMGFWFAKRVGVVVVSVPSWLQSKTLGLGLDFCIFLLEF